MYKLIISFLAVLAVLIVSVELLPPCFGKETIEHRKVFNPTNAHTITASEHLVREAIVEVFNFGKSSQTKFPVESKWHDFYLFASDSIPEDYNLRYHAKNNFSLQRYITLDSTVRKQDFYL